MKTRTLTRLVTLTTLLAFAGACTRHIPVNPDVAISEQKLDGRVQIHLRDGSVLLTEDVVVTDSTFVVSALLDDGHRVPIEPMTILRSDVSSIVQLKGYTRSLIIIVGVLTLFLLPVVYVGASL